VTVEELDVALLVGAAVLLLAVIAVRISVGTGTPSLLLYLVLGVAVGEVGGVDFNNFGLTRVLGYAALVLILIEGGLTTRWAGVRGAVAPAAVLATVGTVVSVLVVAAAAHWLLAADWVHALLIGAVVSSTDAAAVFSVLRRVPLPRRLTGLLEVESGFNDAPVVLAVVALTAAAAGSSQAQWWAVLLLALAELAGGAVIGLLVGWLGATRLRSVALPASGLYPIAVLALCCLAYGAAAVLHTSGFIAVYLAALVLGNAPLPHRLVVRGFAEGLGWLAQIGLFVMLGLLVDPANLPRQVLPALLIGGVLLLVARPLSVLVSVSGFGYRLREEAFLSWAGLRGAVPIVLATVPVVAHAPGTGGLFELVFVLVVVFTVVQAPTLRWVARLLRLEQPDEVLDLEVESSPLGALGAEVLQVRVSPGSRLNGVAVFELRLPEGAQVTLVVRDDEAVVPTAATVLRHGDELLVVTTETSRAEAERRLREVSSGGRLARWRRPPPPETR
jgi:cell volume regulation protein A